MWRCFSKPIFKGYKILPLHKFFMTVLGSKKFQNSKIPSYSESPSNSPLEILKKDEIYFPPIFTGPSSLSLLKVTLIHFENKYPIKSNQNLSFFCFIKN